MLCHNLVVGVHRNQCLLSFDMVWIHLVLVVSNTRTSLANFWLKFITEWSLVSSKDLCKKEAPYEYHLEHTSTFVHSFLCWRHNFPSFLFYNRLAGLQEMANVRYSALLFGFPPPLLQCPPTHISLHSVQYLS